MNKIDEYAKTIWNYMILNQKLKKSDIIFVLGSNDLRVADRAAEIYKEGWAPLIVCAGGNGKASNFIKPEAEMFAERITSLGVLPEVILKEPNSKSTGENVLFTQQLLKDKNLSVKKVIAVQKPHMERRTLVTIMKQWPKIECVVTSPQLTYEEYSTSPDFKDKFISTMVGDLLRIKEYPKLGFQIEQEIPENVWQAGQELLKLGYNKYPIIR